MRGIAVISPSAVTEQMLAEIVGSLRGVWFSDSEIASGTVEREGSAVYIYRSTPVNFTVFESNQINDLRNLLGAEPISYIELGLGRDESSTNLAYEVAASMIERWGGVIEEGDGSFRRFPGGQRAQR